MQSAGSMVRQAMSCVQPHLVVYVASKENNALTQQVVEQVDGCLQLL